MDSTIVQKCLTRGEAYRDMVNSKFKEVKEVKVYDDDDQIKPPSVQAKVDASPKESTFKIKTSNLSA